MKKYKESDVKSLTKSQVIDKLTQEGVEFDSSSNKDNLVKLLLSVEEVPFQESEVETEVSKENDVPEEAIVEAKGEEAIVEAETKLAKIRSNSNADHNAFEDALRKRMGPTVQSTFSTELNKRKGGNPKKASFKDTLVARLKRLGK